MAVNILFCKHFCLFSLNLLQKRAIESLLWSCRPVILALWLSFWFVLDFGGVFLGARHADTAICIRKTERG